MRSLEINKKFIFIVGQPKSGTTSLYNWLSKHPEICPSTIKETRFFLDQDSTQPRKMKFNGKNIDEYLELFPSKAHTYHLEATPDYLYHELPLNIQEHLPNSYFIIIERDPVDRMLSSYRYFQQQGRIPLSLTFEEYVEKQELNNQTSKDITPFHSLEQCKRSYINKFKKKYGNNCLIFDFQLLKENPDVVVDECFKKIGITNCNQSRQDYQPQNVSKNSSSPNITKIFRAVRRTISYSLIKFPRIRKFLGYLSRYIQKFIYRTSVSNVKIDVSQRTMLLINDIASR